MVEREKLKKNAVKKVNEHFSRVTSSIELCSDEEVYTRGRVSEAGSYETVD